MSSHMNVFIDRKRSPNTCLKCGSKNVLVEHFGDNIDFKGLTLEVEGLAQTRCLACGHVWSTEGQEHDNLALIRQAFASKRDEIRTTDGLLTGEQIEDVLELLSLSKADASKLFGGGPNAFSKYVSGDVLQSFAMDRLIRLTLLFGDVAVHLLSLGKHAPLRLDAGWAFRASSAATSASVRMPTSDGTLAAIQIVQATRTTSLAKVD
jgi:putative zinc finger/helix-turn-helix YgiT family protein